MPRRRRTNAATDSSAADGARAMNGSRASRSFALSENARVPSIARGEAGSGTSFPSRTTKRVAASAEGSTRSPRDPVASSSASMSGVVSSALLGPVS